MAYIEDRWFDREGRKTERHGHGKRWRARYRAPDSTELSESFARRTEAQAFLTTMEADKISGRWRDPRLGKTPFHDWARQCLDTRLNLRGATKARDESLVRNHVIPAFGRTPISQISRSDIQAWIAALSPRYSPATVRECYRLLGGIMREAVDHRMIPESPCRRISLPRPERAERRFLSPSEVETLVNEFEERHRALVYTAVYLGPRWEELAGLKRANLELLRRQLRIVGTIERVAGSYRYVEETKTKASRRTLRIPAFLVDILARHLEIAPESEYVFPAPSGGFLRYDNFRRRSWQPAVWRAGLWPLTFHELRHTAAALTINQGADVLQIQRRLGHDDVRTTLNLYGHLFPNREDDLNDALERVFTEARRELGSPAAQVRPQVVSLEKGRNPNAS
jgi:integrase